MIFAPFPLPKLYTKVLCLLYNISVDVVTFTSKEIQDYLKKQGDFGYIFMQNSCHAFMACLFITQHEEAS